MIESEYMEREDEGSSRVELRKCCCRVVRSRKTGGIVLCDILVVNNCVSSGEK